MILCFWFDFSIYQDIRSNLSMSQHGCMDGVIIIKTHIIFSNKIRKISGISRARAYIWKMRFWCERAPTMQSNEMQEQFICRGSDGEGERCNSLITFTSCSVVASMDMQRLQMYVDGFCVRARHIIICGWWTRNFVQTMWTCGNRWPNKLFQGKKLCKSNYTTPRQTYRGCGWSEQADRHIIINHGVCWLALAALWI